MTEFAQSPEQDPARPFRKGDPFERLVALTRYCLSIPASLSDGAAHLRIPFADRSYCATFALDTRAFPDGTTSIDNHALAMEVLTAALRMPVEITSCTTIQNLDTATDETFLNVAVSPPERE